MTEYHIQVADTDEIEAETWEAYTTERGPWINHKYESATRAIAKIRMSGEARALRIVEHVMVPSVKVHETYGAQSPESMEVLMSLKDVPDNIVYLDEEMQNTLGGN